MKHDVKTTLFLISLFIIAQLFNIATLDRTINIHESAVSGHTRVVENKYLMQPVSKDDSLSFLYVLSGVAVGTVFFLLIVKFKKPVLWKLWYFAAVYIATSVVLFPWLPFGEFSPYIAYTLAFIIAILKLEWFNPFFYNLSEILVYVGISVLIVPALTLPSAFLLLFLISLYDMFAVWKSKHMVKMALFQSKLKLFSGLMVPKGKISNRGVTKKVSTAVLGGGDIAFPMLFIGTFLKFSGNYLGSLIIVLFSGLALFMLFVFAKKDRFYPAMPFITLGCVIGYLITLL